MYVFCWKIFMYWGIELLRLIVLLNSLYKNFHVYFYNTKLTFFSFCDICVHACVYLLLLLFSLFFMYARSQMTDS